MFTMRQLRIITLVVVVAMLAAGAATLLNQIV